MGFVARHELSSDHVTIEGQQLEILVTQENRVSSSSTLGSRVTVVAGLEERARRGSSVEKQRVHGSELQVRPVVLFGWVGNSRAKNKPVGLQAN